uniref:Uncharacterized protein n=1 Tax=Lygus hesperus TaxID=30085 RepID=A0A0A9WXU2_LYGHE
MTKGEFEKSPVRNSSEESQKARRSKASEAEKLRAESTTYPTLSTKPSDHQVIKQNCGCSNKRDVFFDKLINYLEKQSEVISRCCFEEKTVSKRNKRLNTDSIFSKTQSPCSEPPTSSNEQKLEDKHKILKSKDNECKIIVEVCTCDKDKDDVRPSESRKSVKPRAISHLEDKKSVANEADCSGCEKKVANFFMLAEDICQAYLKRCLINDDLHNAPSSYSDHNVKIEDLDGLAEPREQRRSRKDTTQDRAVHRDGKGCNSLAVQVECHGDREEFVIHPCDCPPKSGRSPSHHQPRPSQDDFVGNREERSPKRSCIDVFEERYGQILRDLHSNLIKHSPSLLSTPVHGNQPPPHGEQHPYTASQYPSYPPPHHQQPPPRPPPSNLSMNAIPPAQFPTNQNPYQQPHPIQHHQSHQQPHPIQHPQPHQQPQQNQHPHPSFYEPNQVNQPSPEPNVSEEKRKPSRHSLSKDKKKRKSKIE